MYRFARVNAHTAHRLRTVAGGGVATASMGVCVFDIRGPVFQDDRHETKGWLVRMKSAKDRLWKIEQLIQHEVEDLVHDVEEEVLHVVHEIEDEILHEVEVIKHEIEEDVAIIRHKTEDFIHEIEDEVVEYIIHPLRDTFVRIAPYIIPVKKYMHYLAYSSDVGEAFRPIASVMSVNFTYGIAIVYCSGDVLHNGWMEYSNDPDDKAKIALTMVHSAVFQLLASLLAPFMIIHTAVAQSNGLYFKTPRCTNAFAKTWGSSIIALSIIPFLPIVDEPIEEALDWVFDHAVPHKENNKAHAEQQERMTQRIDEPIPA